MQFSTLLHCIVSSIERIALCLAGDRILLPGGVNDNSPCTKHRVVVNVRAYYIVKLFLNVLDMKIQVRDTARLAFIYFRNKTCTYVGG
jgi:hypothetical protein